jgi:hypothetical protein
MGQIKIIIEVPDNATVSVEAPELGPGTNGSGPDEEQVQKYWEFLTENGRTLYGAMATQERENGPFTFEEIADRLGVPLESVHAYNRNAGRGAGMWRKETGTEAPIKPIPQGYLAGRRRKVFRLPDGVAEVIASLD